MSLPKRNFFKPASSRNSLGAPDMPYPAEDSGRLPQEWLGQLGFFDRLRVKAMTRKEIADYVGDAFANYFKAHKEVSARRVALWVEEQSVIDYNAAQLRMQEVEREMTLVATEYGDDLTEALYQFNIRFRERKTTRKRELETMRQEGRLADTDFEAMLALVDEIAEAQCQDVIERVNAVLSKMKERIARALTLFEVHRAV